MRNLHDGKCLETLKRVHKVTIKHKTEMYAHQTSAALNI